MIYLPGRPRKSSYPSKMKPEPNKALPVAYAAVHGGYAPSRKPLLEKGVRIFEARPDAEVAGAELVAADSATATLHTKAFIVDDSELFIGSFNFDPRSAYINTESDVIIHSPAMSKRLADAIDAALAEYAYEVFLNDDGKLRRHPGESRRSRGYGSKSDGADSLGSSACSNADSACYQGV